MTRGLILVIVLALATFVANFFMQDPGYVLLHFRGYAIELSVPGLVLFALLAFVALWLVMRAVRSPFDLGRAAGRYRKNQARNKLTRGLVEAAEGNYARAERLLAEGARKSDTPVLNYLNAARAAQEQGATDRRDNWLMMAYESDEKSGRAVLLTQAQLQMRDSDYESALATLRKLEENAPGHPQGLALLAGIYKQLGDWENLKELLPQLRKRKALPPAEIEALAENAWARLLEHDSSTGDLSRVQQHWQAVPKKLKGSPALFRDYVAALDRAGHQLQAEQAIRKALKKQFDPELVELYSQLDNIDGSMLLGNVQNWLKSRPEEPALLLAAGRLSLRAGLHEDAGRYLETALKVDPSPGAYQAYGALLAESGEAEEAAGAFRKGLAMATGNTESTLPAVTAKPAPEEATSDAADATDATR